MRRKATLVVLGFLFGACDFSKEQFTGDAALPPPTVGFAQVEQLQDENSGALQVVVRLSRPSDEPVTVQWMLTDGTATLGEDYSTPDGVTSGTLEFAVQQTDLGIPLTIMFDTDEQEIDETIKLALSSPTGAELDPAKDEHTLTVSSKPLPRVSFQVDTSNGAEDANISVTFTLDTAPLIESSVSFAHKAASTAAVGHDWTMPAMTTVTFPVNTLTQTITIPVMNDSVDENDETVILELTTTQGLVVGMQNEMTHTILDNDNPPSVSITTASGSTAEGNTGTSTNVEIVVSLSGPSGKVVTVPVMYGGGTANENADYTYLAKEALVFQPNQNPAMSETTKTITITINGDTTDEDNQTIITTLGSPTNATVVMTASSHTQTITDDDMPPSVNFITMNQTVPEFDSATNTTTYQFQLSAASEKMIGFDVDLGGDAQIPSDYTTVPAAVDGKARITIMPGVTMAGLDLVIVGDMLNEGEDETIVMDISMQNLMNVTRGTQRSRTHTIDDAD